MPELPDIQVFANNMQKKFAGKKLKKVKVVNGKKLKDTPATLSKELENKMLEKVYRSGKELRFQFEGGALMGLHLMLTGDIMPFEKKNDQKFAIVEFYFADGSGFALCDRMRNANVKLNPEDKKGIDALDRKLNFKYLKTLLEREAQVKNVLLNQDHIRGIGNAYSDEILWKSGISPFSNSNKIPDEKIKILAVNIKKVLKTAAAKIAKNYPGLIHGEIRDYLEIHTKKKTQSPTGAPILKEDRGMLKTYYTKEQKVYK